MSKPTEEGWYWYRHIGPYDEWMPLEVKYSDDGNDLAAFLLSISWNIKKLEGEWGCRIPENYEIENQRRYYHDQ